MRDILLQLARLRRHHELAVNSNDRIALLDLSHTLRIWTELKREVDKAASTRGMPKPFQSGTPMRSAFKALRGAPYVISILPGGVLTKAGDGAKDIGRPLSIAGSVSGGYSAELMDTEVGLLCRRFCFSYRWLSDEDRAALKNYSITALNYSEWMGAEVVRVCFPDQNGALEVMAINREVLIKRVANTLQGSHSAASPPEEDDKTNRFDRAVQFLLDFKCQGLSAPYFILLKIAQDIIEVSPRILSADGPVAK